VLTYYGLLLSCVCVPQYGRLAAVWVTGVISLRVSPKCTSHIIFQWCLWYIYISGTNNMQHLNDFAIPLRTSLLPYLHHRMCVRGGENNDGYRMRLKIGVRSLLHRKVKSTTACVVMCLFLSMVVWQPFLPYWRYIIARVSEMHVAYHTTSPIVVYLHQRNKQHSTSPTTSQYHSFLHSFLPSLPASSNVFVEGGGKKVADINFTDLAPPPFQFPPSLQSPPRP
jgi:hypothetical protein